MVIGRDGVVMFVELRIDGVGAQAPVDAVLAPIVPIRRQASPSVLASTAPVTDPHPGPKSYGASDRLRARLAMVADSQSAAQQGLSLVDRANQSLAELQDILTELGVMLAGSDGTTPAGSSLDIARLRAEVQRMINEVRFASDPSTDGASLGDTLRGDLNSALAGQGQLLGGAPPVDVTGATALVATTSTELLDGGRSMAAVHVGASGPDVARLVAD